VLRSLRVKAEVQEKTGGGEIIREKGKKIKEEKEKCTACLNYSH
jgi:hypothetical protein